MGQHSACADEGSENAEALSLKKHLGLSKGYFCNQEGALNSRKCCSPLMYFKNHYKFPLTSVSVGLLISLCLLNSNLHIAWGL